MQIRSSWFAVLSLACVLPVARPAPPPTPANGFGMVAIIPLPGVTGRLDHLAYDLANQTVFVVALTSNTVEVVDVAHRRVERRLTGFKEPQGVAYSSALGRLYVASADGQVKSFRRSDYSLDRSADVGVDADNLRLDEQARRLYVGHGDGALAVLDARTLARIADIPLHDHPEGLQLAPGDARIFVNVPGANEIAVVDRASGKQIGQWPNGRLHSNFPLAIDVPNGRIISVFRNPARLVAHELADGTLAEIVPTCSDADDVFVDDRRHQIYVTCGEGVVEILSSATLKRMARLPTAPGARTGLFDADADRLFVAVRADGGASAALWVLAPAP